MTRRNRDGRYVLICDWDTYQLLKVQVTELPKDTVCYGAASVECRDIVRLTEVSQTHLLTHEEANDWVDSYLEVHPDAELYLYVFGWR